MKTKKLLSLLLANVIVLSMMATFGVTANAAIMHETVTVGQTATTTIFGKLDSTDDENNVKDVKSLDTDSLKVTASQTAENTITIYGTGVKVSDSVTVTYQKYYSGSWHEIKIYFKVNAAPNECYLDLESATNHILESKDLDQNYNLTVTPFTSASGAVTKVKLNWEINDINAIRVDNKVWDTEELKWVVASSSTNVMNNGTAKFTLENYSSVKVRATASFAAETGFNPTVTYSGRDGRITLDTANGNDTCSKTNIPTGTINVTIKPGADDFKTLAATTSATKYGTYTVTISENISEYQSYANGIEGATAPSTFIVDNTAKTITIKDEKAFIYYGLKWTETNAYQWTAKLNADLDLDDLVITNGFNCYANLDGQNHTVKNLTVNGAANAMAGFFNKLNEYADEDCISVKNLVLDSITVKGTCTNGGDYGILAGFSNCEVIQNVTVKNSSVTGAKYTGGIVGRTYSDIIGCTVKDCIVSGQYKCGGIVGFVAEGDGKDIQNNTLNDVTINCANLLEGKDHYETGKVIGDWNAATGTYIGNTVTGVTIVNGSVGYTDNEIGAVEDGCTIDYGEPD